MAIYREGSILITGGSQLIVGTGTAWKDAIRVGSMLSFNFYRPIFQVAQVVDDFHIMLSKPIGLVADGVMMPNVSYALSADFTPNFNFIYPNVGDRDTAAVLKRAFHDIDRELNAKLEVLYPSVDVALTTADGDQLTTADDDVLLMGD